MLENGAVVQIWLECLPVTQEVVGSSPISTAKRLPEGKRSRIVQTRDRTILKVS